MGPWDALASIRRALSGVPLVLSGISLVLTALGPPIAGAAERDAAATPAPLRETPALLAAAADPPAGSKAPAKPPKPGAGGEVQTASASSGAITPTATFSLESFQTDLFTGGATSEIAIAVPPGAAGVAPVIRLRYNSTPIDDLPQTDQWQGPGLGWTLDLGGFILRNTADDSFRLVYGGRAHDLVLVDSTQKLYRTKDEIFVRLRYDTSGATDYWTLTTKDGAVHVFGQNSDSRANAYRPDLVTPVVYKYLLDEVNTPSGVVVRYAYAKQTAMVYGTTRVYDRAVYPDVITWAYAGGGAVGATREVRFVRSGTRGDYTDSSAAQGMAFFETQRLDAIEVRVGASLVRRYALGYDYSADRDPTRTWDDGTPGDLTLRTVTVVGSDGTATLPPASFSYTNARLSTATNGLGGDVSFTYERVQTRPLYSSCEAYVTGEFGNVVDCGMWAPSLTTDPYGYTVSVGHILSAADWETVPLYRVCTFAAYPRDEWGNIIGPLQCSEYGLGSAPDGWGFSTLLGHAEGNSIVGMWELFSACKSPAWNEYNQVVGCADWTAAITPDGWGLSTLVGHSYVSRLDRYRVSQRLVTDGRSGTVNTTYDYRDLGLSPNGTEFRGHGAARAIDALGNYTDTWFYQDDLKKGRPYAAETRSQSGALYARVSSTWSTSNPYPGVTFVRLDRTDAYSYEGGSTPKQTAATFEYDAYGNRTRAVSLGDVAVSGDERDERVDWAVDAASWLMRPTRVALHDGAGALLRERWLSYDGLGWGSLGARGMLTRDEARLAGGRGTAGNPAVTHAYDGYGNRTSTTDPRGCTTTTTFEAEQVYPASATTCLGHATTFAHDARFGVRTGLTDPNGQTTTSIYDVFGRLTRVTGPFDTGSTYGSVSTFYENLGSPSAQRIVTYRTEQHGTGSVLWSAQYFDGLGRVYRTDAEGPGGQVIVSETTFDSRGLVAQRSAPRFTAEGALWTTLSYDALGRPVQVRHPDNSVATTSYALSGVAGAVSQVAVTDERGTVRRRHLSAHGQVLRVEEVNGAETSVTTYEYDATGALTRVTDHAGRVTTMTYDALGRKGAMQDPNMGNWTYGYDITGNLTSQTDARGQTLTFTYDLQGRILTKAYPGGAQIQWTYDDPAVPYSRGRLTRVDDLAVSTRFTYNALGRVTQTVRLLDATTYVMSQSYDALGRVVSQTFPDSETVSYTYNEAGWLSAIPGYVTSLTYNARGQRTQMQYANGVTATWTYDATTFRLSQAQAANGATALQHFTYAYDPGGLITGITDSLWTGTRSFGYDPLGRLLSASGPFGPLIGGLPAETAQTYSYDATGNILSRAGISYTYADPLHPAAVTALSTGSNYSYDASGNMLTGAGRALAWDADGRLAAVTVDGGNTATFAYDSTGMRVRKQTASGTLRYPFAGYEEDHTGVRTKYIFLGLERVALKRSTGGTHLTFWYHNDHLGGVNVITDAAGAKVQLAEYSPWGWITRSEGTVDLTHRFNGKERDPETGLYYYGGRYYDPHLGRFISADPFVPSPGNPQSLNRYSYTLNDPVNHLDPSGYFFSKLWKSLKKWVSGHKTVSLLVGSLLRFSPFPEMRLAGAAILFQSDTGRYILSAEIIAGTAAATFYCGGCGAALGALIGEVVGGLSAHQSGGDVLAGVLFGGATGALTGYLGGVVPVPGKEASLWVKAGAAFARGVIEGAGIGAADGFAGGRGNAQAVLFAAAIAGVQSGALRALYTAYVGFAPTLESGGAAAPRGALDPAPEGRNVIGKVVELGEPICRICEGSPLSEALNRIRGANAGAGLHDTLMISVEKAFTAAPVVAEILNWGSIVPAAAFTYAGFVGGVPASQLHIMKE